MSAKRRLRVVVYKDGAQWVAQCLEVNLVARASTVEELGTRFVNTLRAEVVVSAQLNVEPFTGLPQAPRRYWEMWEACEREEREATTKPESVWDALLRSCGLDAMLQTSLAFAH